MKFLEYTPLARLNSFLSHLSLGDHLIQGTLEAYSCKVAGADKKLSRSLEQEVVDSLAFSPQELAASPVGPLCNSSSRKTLVYLILTLSHVYPDYDFSKLRSYHFSKEGSLSVVNNSIDQYLADAAKAFEASVGDDKVFPDALWSAIDEVVQLSDCEVYSYCPDDTVFYHKNSIWSFAYFFYNKKLKRVLFFSCRCKSTPAFGEESSSDEAAGSDFGDMADEMDLED